MTVTTSPSRRIRHRLATRTALAEAALSLTEELGLAAVTIEAITERADVAPRTLANYFPSKEDAVLGHDPADWTRAAEAFTGRPAGEDTWAALRAVLIDGTPECTGPLDVVLRRTVVMRHEPRLLACSAGHFDRVARELLAAVCQRNGTEPATDLSATVMVYTALNACRAAVLWWSAAQPRPDLDQVLQRTFDQLAAGQPAPAG